MYLNFGYTLGGSVPELWVHFGESVPELWVHFGGSVPGESVPELWVRFGESVPKLCVHFGESLPELLGVFSPKTKGILFTPGLRYTFPKMKGILSPGCGIFSPKLRVYFHLVAVYSPQNEGYTFTWLRYIFPKTKGILSPGCGIFFPKMKGIILPIIYPKSRSKETLQKRAREPP